MIGIYQRDPPRLKTQDGEHTVVYHYRETQTRSLKWLALHTVHDLQHRLHDIRRQIA